MKFVDLHLLILSGLCACSLITQAEAPKLLPELQTNQVQLVKDDRSYAENPGPSYAKGYYLGPIISYRNLLATEDSLILAYWDSINLYLQQELTIPRVNRPPQEKIHCIPLRISSNYLPQSTGAYTDKQTSLSPPILRTPRNSTWLAEDLKQNIYASFDSVDQYWDYKDAFSFKVTRENLSKPLSASLLEVHHGCSPHTPLLKPDQKAPTDYAGIAVTPQDQVYLAAINEHRIYQIKDGTLIPFAGTGTAGNQDGPAEQAQFQKPRAIESDAEGNLYVLEADAPRLRKITPQGHVSTLAGSLESGYADGQGAEARFNQPYDLAINAKGEILIADTGNHRIRKVTPDGQVTTVLGTGEKGYSEGNQATAKVGNPMGLDFAPDDTLYYIAEGRVFRTKWSPAVTQKTNEIHG